MGALDLDDPLRRPNVARIDLDVLRANFGEVVRRSGDRRVVASVKADGYGHGVVEVSRALVEAGCESLWTGHIGHALALKAAGIDAEVVLFGGYTPEQIPALVAAGLVPTVVDLAGAAAAAGAGAAVYVKVDAGLGRLGIPVAEARSVIGEMAALDGLTVAGVYTHLPFGDRAGRAWAVERSARFSQLLDDLAEDGIRPGFTQVWGSSGLLAGLPDGTSAVCVGHALYGLSPYGDASLTDAVLAPVLAHLGSRLVHVADHPDDAGGGGYLTRAGVRVGVLPFGVTDGQRRAAGCEAHVLVRGRRAPVLGTSLEHTVVDLTGVPDAVVGDPVTIVGVDGDERITLGEWAASAGRTELEAALAIAGRVARDTRAVVPA